MTAVIGVLNKQAIAVAADSAVTIGSSKYNELLIDNLKDSDGKLSDNIRNIDTNNLIISGLIPRGSAPERWVQGSTLGFNTFYSKSTLFKCRRFNRTII